MPLGRRIFCNRALNMDKISAVGFDLDYTLAEYKKDFDRLAYDGAIRKLKAMGYPAEELDKLEYLPQAYQRGLMIDKRRGNLIKMDRHKYVKVAFHGTTELQSTERKAIYSQSYEQQPQFNPPDYASVDTEFLLVDVCLFSQLVDLKDRNPKLMRQSYAEIYKNVRRAVDLCHCDGEIKDPVAVEPSQYIEESPELASMLTQLRLGGKKVFLLTNSLFDYTKVVCNFLLGENWVDYFDLVICGARKPGFLLDPYLPLFQVNQEDASLVNVELGSGEGAAAALAAGKVFQGGNWNHLHRMLEVESGSEIMYVGDHMYSDILRSKRTLGWRTVLIVPELATEAERLEQTEENRRESQVVREQRAAVDMALRRLQLRRLTQLQEGASSEELAPLDAEHLALETRRDELSETIAASIRTRHRAFHPEWGQLFKAGHQNSRWAQQVQEYACLYTSHATNLLYATGNTTFRALSDMMPHDRAVIDESECTIP
jgi:5'-nucleotidase